VRCLERGFDVGEAEAGFGEGHTDVGAFAADEDDRVIGVGFAAHKDVQEVVAKNHDLVKVVCVAFSLAARFTKELFDGDDGWALEEVCGGCGDQIQNFRGVGVDGFDAQEHTRRHIDVAACDTLGDVIDGLLNGLV
jgi:hypothetical protein